MSSVAAWLAANAKQLVYVNLGWYVLLALAFISGGDIGRTLYFAGAAILTMGVLLIK